MIIEKTKRFSVGDTIDLYEGNYARLICLVPDLSLLTQTRLLEMTPELSLRMEVIERTRYTTVLLMRGEFAHRQSLVSEPVMKVRVSHDAQVAEVISYQDHGRLDARYEQPNRAMMGRFEKRQVNRFLREWLDCCFSRDEAFAARARLTRTL